MRKEVLSNKEYKKFLGDLHKLANKHGLSISHFDFINPPEDGDYSNFEMYQEDGDYSYFEMYEMCLERKGGE